MIRIRDPQVDFLELRPGEAVLRDVRIGVHARNYESSSSVVAFAGRENEPTPFLKSDSSMMGEEEEVSICATSMKELSKGEEYEVQFAHAPAEWPNHVWWWTCGTKDDVLREAGRRGVEGLMALTGEDGERIFAVRRGGGSGFVRVEMAERAVIGVVE